MARTRLGRAGGLLGDGIALHHSADHAFPAQPWFLEPERELRPSLSPDALPDGAARACAHVGPELLLDGALVDELDVARGVDVVYRSIAEPADEIVDLVD